MTQQQHDTMTDDEPEGPTIKYIDEDGVCHVRAPEFLTAHDSHVVFGLDDEKVRIPWRRVVETREPYGDN